MLSTTYQNLHTALQFGASTTLSLLTDNNSFFLPCFPVQTTTFAALPTTALI